MALKTPRVQILAETKASATRKDVTGELTIGKNLRIDLSEAVEAYGFSLANIDNVTPTEFVLATGAVTTAGGSTATDADLNYEGRAIAGGGAVLLLIVSAPATNSGLVTLSHEYLSGKVAPGGCLVLVAPEAAVGGSGMNTAVEFLSANGTEGADVSVWTT